MREAKGGEGRELKTMAGSDRCGVFQCAPMDRAHNNMVARAWRSVPLGADRGQRMLSDADAFRGGRLQ